MASSVLIQPFQLSNGLRFSGGRVSTELLYLNTNKPASELAPISLTHGDQAALYFAGLCDRYGIKTGLDTKTQMSCRAHYESVHNNFGNINCNNDAVLYDTELNDAGLYLVPGTILQEGNITVPWIVRPEWDHGMVPKMGKKSRAVIAVLPPNGYGLIHLRDSNTGWVLQTRESREEAEKLVALEFSKFMSDSKAADLAREEVSYSHRKQKGEGKLVVCRESKSVYDPFYENAGLYSVSNGTNLGAFSFA
ncbi:MAG TPA: hypothetical protein VI968_03095 [archaeon]|nr:hypothetical protein [archaeon]